MANDYWLVCLGAGQWCGPCNFIKGELPRLSRMLGDRVKIGMYATLTNSVMVDQYEVIFHCGL
jgi:thiol-disulfide isomerase/thioredoxin